MNRFLNRYDYIRLVISMVGFILVFLALKDVRFDDTKNIDYNVEVLMGQLHGDSRAIGSIKE